MTPLRLGVSPLTNTIYAGRVTKLGMWAPNKQDVTIEALSAVVEHCKNHTQRTGTQVELTGGDTIYCITITEKPVSDTETAL